MPARGDELIEPASARVPVLATLRLVRVHAALTAALLGLLGAHLSGLEPAPGDLLLIALTVAFATAGGNALNDVYDRAIDAVNRRDRPIPSGAIGTAAATHVAVVAFLLAMACAAMLSPWCLAICVVNSLLLAGYARHSKRLGAAKCAIVGYLVGSTVLFGAYSPDLINVSVATLAVCAALATFAREVIKDIEDVRGDAGAGARTLPVLIGTRPSYGVALVALVLAVAITPAPYLAQEMGGHYAVLVALGAAVLASAFAAHDARRAQYHVMVGSVVEMAAFFFGAA